MMISLPRLEHPHLGIRGEPRMEKVEHTDLYGERDAENQNVLKMFALFVLPAIMMIFFAVFFTVCLLQYYSDPFQ